MNLGPWFSPAGKASPPFSFLFSRHLKPLYFKLILTEVVSCDQSLTSSNSLHCITIILFHLTFTPLYLPLLTPNPPPHFLSAVSQRPAWWPSSLWFLMSSPPISCPLSSTIKLSYHMWRSSSLRDPMMRLPAKVSPQYSRTISVLICWSSCHSNTVCISPQNSFVLSVLYPTQRLYN